MRKKIQRPPRFTKRLQVKFSSGEITFTGILSNLSENGLFIRTNRGFSPGTNIDIELVMPDGTSSFLRGIVRWASKIPLTSIKNGMGVELLEQDTAFKNLLKTIYNERGVYTNKEQDNSQEFHIISCKNCGVKNKVVIKKISLGPKCGRCGTPLTLNMP